MVRAAQPAPSSTSVQIPEEVTSSSVERVPVSQRLGPVNQPKPKRKVRSKQSPKRKVGRPPGKRASPKPLAGVKSKKLKLLNQQTIPFPRRRLILDQDHVSEDPMSPHRDEAQMGGPSIQNHVDFHSPRSRLT